MTTGREHPSLSTLFAIFFGVLIIGVLYLRQFALDTGLPMNMDRSIFWAINAITLTGFRLSPNGLNDFSPAGVLGVYILMIVGSLFALIIGGMLVCKFVGLAHSLTKLAAGAVFLVFGGTLAGMVFLVSSGRPFYAAMFEATSALTNTGLNLDGGRTIADWRLHLVILPLAAVGAIGLPVVLDLFDALTVRRPISRYSRRVIRLFFIAWIASFALLLLGNSHLGWRDDVLTSWTGAMNTRSLGAEIHTESTLPRLSLWCMGILMLIGAPPAGTGGGLRLLPIGTILRQNQWENDGGYANAAIARATAWLTLFAVLFAALYLLLMSAEPQLGTDRIFAMAAGALGNAGMSHDDISLSTRGLMMVSTGMLAGYLLPLRFMHLIVGRQDNSLVTD